MSLHHGCRHIHQNGTFCQSPPVRGRGYCYAHLQRIGRRMQMAQAVARAQRWQLDLPMPEDLHSVQTALAQVMDAIAADRIDPRRAQLLISVLRLASSNLKSNIPWDQPRVTATQPADARVSDDPGFEKNYGLPDGLDLSLSPQAAFPASTAEEEPESSKEVGQRSAPTVPVTVADIALWRHLHETAASVCEPVQQGASLALFKLPARQSREAQLQRRALELMAQGRTPQVTPFDVELMEIYANQGNDAMLKRIRQHETDRRRQESRRKSRALSERLAGEAHARNAANLAAQLLAESLPETQAAEPAQVTESAAGSEAVPATATAKKPPQPEMGSSQLPAASGQ